MGKKGQKLGKIWAKIGQKINWAKNGQKLHQKRCKLGKNG